MHLINSFLFACLTFAWATFAARVTFTAYYNNAAFGRKGDPRALDCDDDKTAAILHNMQTWSGGRYTAVPGRNGIVRVTNASPGYTYPSASDAGAAVQDMMSVVIANYVPPQEEKV